MDVSLVIPTLNAGRRLQEVLDAIDRQPGAERLEKVAVDSGSSDGTVALLRSHGFRVLAVERRAFDHGGTRDFAISETRGEFVALLTQDATPADERWLPALLACYEDPRVAAAYSRQIPRPGCNPIVAQRIENWAAGGTRRVEQELGERVTFDELKKSARLRLCVYDNVAGSVRRSVWERYRFGPRAFGEDLEFGRRVVQDGWRIVFEPKSAVLHSHERSPWAEAKRIYCDHQNLAELFGMSLVSSLAALRAQAREAHADYARLVSEAELTPGRRHELEVWGRRYALASHVAMYLGARAPRWQRGPFGVAFRALDRALRRGI